MGTPKCKFVKQLHLKMAHLKVCIHPLNGCSQDLGNDSSDLGPLTPEVPHPTYSLYLYSETPTLALFSTYLLGIL